MPKQPTPKAPTEPKLQKDPRPAVGGWLVVLIIVLIVGAILSLSTFSVDLQVLFHPSVQPALATHPALHHVLVFELFGLGLSMLAAAFGVYLIVRRRRLARYVVAGTLLGVLLFTVFDVFWLTRVLRNDTAALKQIQDSGAFTRALLATFVWLPYLWNSKRVARVLVESTSFGVGHTSHR